MTEESQIKKQICDALAKFPHRCMFTLTTNLTFSRTAGRSKFMQKGWPDITGIWDGKPLFIEVKTAKGIVSDEQRSILARAGALGAIAFVARSVSDLMLHLDLDKA